MCDACKNNDMNEEMTVPGSEVTDADNALKEEQLGSVTGGLSNNIHSKECYFVHANPGTAPTKVSEGVYKALCGSFCGTARALCHCNHDKERCVDRWHVVTVNGSPLPNASEHSNWYA